MISGRKLLLVLLAAPLMAQVPSGGGGGGGGCTNNCTFTGTTNLSTVNVGAAGSQAFEDWGDSTSTFMRFLAPTNWTTANSQGNATNPLAGTNSGNGNTYYQTPSCLTVTAAANPVPEICNWGFVTIPGGSFALQNPIGAYSTVETVITQSRIPANSIQNGTTYRVTTYGLGSDTGIATTCNLNYYWGTAGTTSDQQVGTMALTTATSGTNVAFKSVADITFRGASSMIYNNLFINGGITGISTTQIVFAGPTSNTPTAGFAVVTFLTTTAVCATSNATISNSQAIAELVKP